MATNYGTDAQARAIYKALTVEGRDRWLWRLSVQQEMSDAEIGSLLVLVPLDVHESIARGLSADTERRTAQRVARRTLAPIVERRIGPRDRRGAA